LNIAPHSGHLIARIEVVVSDREMSHSGQITSRGMG
jgi:hypothetical protein